MSAITMFAAGPVPELTLKLAPLLVINNLVWCVCKANTLCITTVANKQCVSVQLHMLANRHGPKLVLASCKIALIAEGYVCVCVL